MRLQNIFNARVFRKVSIDYFSDSRIFTTIIGNVTEYIIETANQSLRETPVKISHLLGNNQIEVIFKVP